MFQCLKWEYYIAILIIIIIIVQFLSTVVLMLHYFYMICWDENLETWEWSLSLNNYIKKIEFYLECECFRWLDSSRVSG